LFGRVRFIASVLLIGIFSGAPPPLPSPGVPGEGVSVAGALPLHPGIWRVGPATGRGGWLPLAVGDKSPAKPERRRDRAFDGETQRGRRTESELIVSGVMKRAFCAGKHLFCAMKRAFRAGKRANVRRVGGAGEAFAAWMHCTIDARETPPVQRARRVVGGPLLQRSLGLSGQNDDGIHGSTWTIRYRPRKTSNKALKKFPPRRRRVRPWPSRSAASSSVSSTMAEDGGSSGAKNISPHLQVIRRPATSGFQA